MTSQPQHINVSASARAHIRAQVKQQNAKFLRLGVKESGCNGYMYTLDFLNEAAPDDIQVAVDNSINICIRQEDLSLVDGTEMDLVTEGLNSSLVFKNSRAQSYCGCGESFAMNDAAFTQSDSEYDDTAAALARDASATD